MIELLQRLLGVEHAASYACGLAGGQLAEPARQVARDAEEAHRMRRDRLRALLRDAGAQPLPAAPAYELASPATGAEAALALAAAVEDFTAAAYHSAIAETDDEQLRIFTVGALQDAAGRGARFRLLAGAGAAAAQAFPGR